MNVSRATILRGKIEGAIRKDNRNGRASTGIKEITNALRTGKINGEPITPAQREVMTAMLEGFKRKVNGMQLRTTRKK
ncbi:MAG: hypothetical protein PHQ98_00500 [Candidatus ainarchaeum sp.]|nr:hypothetical protein [Candidatus ainarchaeum sp.]